MEPDERLIELVGYTKAIVFKDRNVIVFVFNDDEFGEIVCQSGRDTILYYNIDPDKKYHLKARLKGMPTETRPGKIVLNNTLNIKNVREVITNETIN